MCLGDVWKNEDSLSELAFRKKPALRQALANLNTDVSSSASVERMFSTGKGELRAKKAAFSDANLERLVFVKGRRKVKVITCRQPRRSDDLQEH